MQVIHKLILLIYLIRSDALPIVLVMKKMIISCLVDKSDK